MPLEDARDPPLEEETVDEVESQGSRTNDGEPDGPVEDEEEDLQEQEEVC